MSSHLEAKKPPNCLVIGDLDILLYLVALLLFLMRYRKH